MHDTGDVGALVLAGAVAKGAFEAGVTRELVARGMWFNRFVGTSAGALNATLLAAGAAAGRLDEAAEKLEDTFGTYQVSARVAQPARAARARER